MRLSVTHTGAVPDNLRAIAKRLTNYAPLLEEFGKGLTASIRSNIDESRTPSGKPYPPLKYPRPRGHNPSPKPLIDSGDMYRSIRHVVTPPDTVRAGASFDRAVWQNRGTRTIPARTFVGLRSEDRNSLREQMKRFIENAFRT
jgi:phage gpG-like protein